MINSEKNTITEDETAMDMRFDHLYKSKKYLLYIN